MGEKSSALGSFNVLTRSYDNQRTGANTSETILTPVNATAGYNFRKLYGMYVDDHVYAQVLYASAVPGLAMRNVVYVATMSNSVYAFDADNGGLIWNRNYSGPGNSPIPSSLLRRGIGCPQWSGPNLGILGTPVIDANTSTMYFVTFTLDSAQQSLLQTFHYRLHAVDIATGAERPFSPVAIGPTPSGFNPERQAQRPGLALSNSTVYVGFGGICDTPPFHGWLLAYDTTTLAQTGIWDSSPTAEDGGGIWQSGQAPAVDAAGNVYVTTGNGSFNETQGLFGDSVVKLAPRSLARLSYFTPENWRDLKAADNDLGVSGPQLFPSNSGFGDRLVQGSKTRDLFLLSQSDLGRLGGFLQDFQAADPLNERNNLTHHIHNGVVLWRTTFFNAPALQMFIWAENDYLRSYPYNSSTNLFSTTTFTTGTILPPTGMPGGIMALSSNGTNPNTGIVWATTTWDGMQPDAENAIVPGALYAFRANQLGSPVWSSRGSSLPISPSDDIGLFAKLNPPLVARGRVYVPTFSNVVWVFGIAGDMPVTGDWDGNGTTTIGIFRPAGTQFNTGTSGQFILSNRNDGTTLDHNFPLGVAGDIPVTGDWDGNGTTTVGVFRPAGAPLNPGTVGRFLLSNHNPGTVEYEFAFGAPGDIPITGDWDGNGTTTVGVFRPAGAQFNPGTEGQFILTNSVNGSTLDYSPYYGAPGDVPITGDWDTNMTTTIGVFRPSNTPFNNSNSPLWLLRNSNTRGAPDSSFSFGERSEAVPITGDWTGSGRTTVGVFVPGKTPSNFLTVDRWELTTNNITISQSCTFGAPGP